ncbi:CopD family protein [Altererythrobacter sp. SALINAS58]|uniref:CopD family protein n=1 Tax=Alteripontixanthobacter muriae TaxID=2705546 RepID=UPI00157734AC|nr:CopD family protein [Alteripontixanthobacter muriae]NTZ43532.1 CopD family protein [Alteripontixanthobacter muriae]
MQETLAMLYFWLKAGHLIFVIFWMAGLFILPRQLIYMHASPAGSEEEALWASRGRTLRKMILIPSLIVVWVLGLILAVTIGAFEQGWFHAKLLLVILLTAYHGWLTGVAKKMAGGARPLTEKALRLWGEVPAGAVALIVVLVIVKPF